MSVKESKWKKMFNKGKQNDAVTTKKTTTVGAATSPGRTQSTATNEGATSKTGTTANPTTPASIGNSVGNNTVPKQTNSPGTGVSTNTPGSTPTTTTAGTTVTTGTSPYKTTGNYGYAYKPATLSGTPGWTPPTDRTSSSNIAVEIMSYRRQYRSQGIALFAKDWLEPTLDRIVKYLRSKGYTVAQSTVYSGDGYGYGNYMFDVSNDGVVSDVLHVAHYDTVDRDTGYAETRWSHGAPATEKSNQRTRKKVSIKNGVASLASLHIDNTEVGCLGADDGAGLAVMLNLMLSGVLGGYCFTTGEEVGGIGADTVTTGATSFLKQYKIAIEVDRKGTTDVVYEQGVGECASKEFAQWLCDSLGMEHKPSDRGSYTDVATFAEVIPENVNIASGYINAHSADEQVDLAYLDKLTAALKKVDWSKAVIKREAGEFNLPTYDYGNYGYTGNYYGNYGTAGTTATKTTHGKGTDYDEPVPDMVVILFAKDPDFMRYCLEVGVASLYDLDTACLDYFGNDFETTAELHSLIKVH